ncbi:hypothetical protein EFA46_015865 (plasmid) [Halarchaeum sp. CBA1220]|uniref:hypothetical protein n=1 Tax=Halarchaeum sp. CBA1220 TaxID=1853682 RepID=UPI000F3A938C|nr:hypothetical protein [Halarchaeum sp. CBA1220]QLC35734.1 hypothetical protein EFA46_015865 [Halarchaeum sp. CBA1220]
MVLKQTPEAETTLEDALAQSSYTPPTPARDTDPRYFAVCTVLSATAATIEQLREWMDADEDVTVSFSQEDIIRIEDAFDAMSAVVSHQRSEEFREDFDTCPPDLRESLDESATGIANDLGLGVDVPHSESK